MLSLETARKLKEAGLRWEPKVGDLLYDESGKLCEIHHISTCRKFVWVENGLSIRERDKTVYIPRLEQLLAEIKARGWEYTLYSDNTIDIETDKESIPVHLWLKTFVANTPEEAAARALLWILKQEPINRPTERT